MCACDHEMIALTNVCGHLCGHHFDHICGGQLATDGRKPRKAFFTYDPPPI